MKTKIIRSEPRVVFPLMLTAVRMRRTLNQRELGEKAGLSESWINHFERGRRMPNVACLVKLADALDVPIDYLLGRSKNSGNSD